MKIQYQVLPGRPKKNRTQKISSSLFRFLNYNGIIFRIWQIYTLGETMARNGGQRRGSTVSSSTTSYIFTRLYKKDFRKTSKSQNHPANRLYLAGSRSLSKKAQSRNSDDCLSHSGRKKICNDEVINAVRVSVLNSSKRSTKERCQLVG